MAVAAERVGDEGLRLGGAGSDDRDGESGGDRADELDDVVLAEHFCLPVDVDH